MSTKPQSITIIDSAVNGMRQLTQLCRDGYLLVEVECINLLGLMKATLVLENPNPDVPAN